MAGYRTSLRVLLPYDEHVVAPTKALVAGPLPVPQCRSCFRSRLLPSACRPFREPSSPRHLHLAWSDLRPAPSSSPNATKPPTVSDEGLCVFRDCFVSSVFLAVSCSVLRSQALRLSCHWRGGICGSRSGLWPVPAGGSLQWSAVLDWRMGTQPHLPLAPPERNKAPGHF